MLYINFGKSGGHCENCGQEACLQANRRKLMVKAFVHPNQFKKYEEFGYSSCLNSLLSRKILACLPISF